MSTTRHEKWDLITFADAIRNLDTNKDVSGWSENTFASIDTISGKEVSFTETELSTEIKRLEDEYDAQEYARNRAAEYPSIEELTVALYDEDDKAAIIAKRAAVKKKYPKPSE